MATAYTPHTEADREAMLAVIGSKSLDELFAHLPQAVRAGRLPDVPGPLSEEEIARTMGALADRNVDAGRRVCFLGMGAYDHHIPAVVGAAVSRGELFTSYTPYQPEVSQGGLQAMFEYQTMMASLTGLEVANSSLYDGATAVYEAALLALRLAVRRGAVVSEAEDPL